MNVLLRILFRLLFLTFSGLGVSHIQRIGYQSEGIALHDGQSRSCSAGHGKQDKNRKSGNPPPQTLIVRKKTNKQKETWCVQQREQNEQMAREGITWRIYMHA